MAYKDTGEFNILYPTRRKVANVLKKLIADEGLIETRTLYESVRINAKVSTEGNLRIQILAAYYFGFLNNGTTWIAPYDLVRKFNTRLEQEGLINEMYGQYVSKLAKTFPILDLGGLLRQKVKVIYDFEPLFGEFFNTLTF
jgi:hypothetical protein